MKGATRADITLKRLETICGDLAKRVAELHEEVKDTAVKNARNRALRDARKKSKGALAFQVGDLVMIAAQDNAANIKKKAKPMVNWQGPYEVVRAVSVSEYDVRLLGDPVDRVKPVHWSMLKRFAGPEFHKTPELVEAAQHDRQRFYVEQFEDW